MLSLMFHKDKSHKQVLSLYKLLDPLSINLDEEQVEEFLMSDKLADGGAAMTAYALLQFTNISALYMSRTQLHRRIKALSDKSITAYIRSYRLLEAMKLIKQTSNTKQQIAFETGFSDPSYFHHSFVKEFSQKPTDIRK